MILYIKRDSQQELTKTNRNYVKNFDNKDGYYSELFSTGKHK